MPMPAPLPFDIDRELRILALMEHYRHRCPECGCRLIERRPRFWKCPLRCGYQNEGQDWHIITRPVLRHHKRISHLLLTAQG